MKEFDYRSFFNNYSDKENVPVCIIERFLSSENHYKFSKKQRELIFTILSKDDLFLQYLFQNESNSKRINQLFKQAKFELNPYAKLIFSISKNDLAAATVQIDSIIKMNTPLSLTTKCEENFFTIREDALRCLLQNQFHESKKLYCQIFFCNPINITLHFIRLYLSMEQIRFSFSLFNILKLNGDLKNNDEKYEELRYLYFELLFKFLNFDIRKNKKDLLSEIIDLIYVPSNLLNWDLYPLFGVIKKTLKPEDYDILLLLGEVIGTKRPVTALKENTELNLLVSDYFRRKQKNELLKALM